MRDLACAVIGHHLRLFGLTSEGATSCGAADRRLVTYNRPCARDVPAVHSHLANGGAALIVLPDDEFCQSASIRRVAEVTAAPAVLEFVSGSSCAWRRLRSLHPVTAYTAENATCVVRRRDGAAAWLWLPIGHGGMLIVGTDIAADLIRYRQGDPEQALQRPAEAMWGVAGERPMYLFDAQLEGELPQERHADWWAMALATTLAQRLGRHLAPMLPGGAPGAVVVTGDDDQAYLDKYNEQLAILGRTPITYFLHPLTRHDRKSLTAMRARWAVDLGIHPDAIEHPTRYRELIREQAAWYRRLTGEAAAYVRNHGYLNDGYWNHLPCWIEAGIRMSSNLPGLDGRILNGSLLPARVAFDGRLTNHWSLLTAIGDGVRSIRGMSEREAGDCVLQLADRIRHSSLPGVMVVNLHPQNIGDTQLMHRAVLEVVRGGFQAWSMSDCLDWFDRRDGGEGQAASARPISLGRRLWGRLRTRSTGSYQA